MAAGAPNTAAGADRDSIEQPRANVQQINPATVGLAAAVAERKPNPWSWPMIRLYSIMLVGYLVSTINGYGTFVRGYREHSYASSCH